MEASTGVNNADRKQEAKGRWLVLVLGLFEFYAA